MNNMFPKDIMDCMKECILSIFWAKKDIVEFFENNGCTSNDFRCSKKLETLHRAEVVNMVFSNLSNRTDDGLGQFRSMLKSLTEWDYFNPYYFGELKKLDEERAKKNILHLKQLQEIRDQKIKLERQKKEEKTKNNEKKYVSIEQMKDKYLNLFSGKDTDGKTISDQKRGYLFEEFLQELFQGQGIEVTEPFKITGEQIDGAIKYDGEHYLMEAKWQNKWSTSESLYQFAMKCEGKLYGRGVFISVNGFSMESVKSLITGKAVRTILIDGADLMLLLEGLHTVKEMLDSKIKAAQTRGRIYVNIDDLSSKIEV